VQLQKPKALNPGDTISVVVPAGPIDRKRIERAFERIRQLGFKLKTYGDIFRRTGYLAGDDATRADELMQAFADPESSAVWCARGGYGVVRLLDRLDFDVIRRNPKVFVGFSDITILHLAIQQRAGLITFHGPNLQDGFGKPDEMPAATAAALWRALSGKDLNVDHQPPSEDGAYQLDLSNVEPLDIRTIIPGTAQGRITGGNLAVICGLLGTPYEIDTTGRILFLEDVSERVYRIDRYLAQLTLAGKLGSAAGVVFGTFSYDDDEPAESQAEVAALIDKYCRPLQIPVLAGFPAGHAQYNLTLPMGALAEIDADRRIVRLLENPVAPPSPSGSKIGRGGRGPG
jgi:muramoyltetrapeptide carboxypeptidase